MALCTIAATHSTAYAQTPEIAGTIEVLAHPPYKLHPYSMTVHDDGTQVTMTMIDELSPGLGDVIEFQHDKNFSTGLFTFRMFLWEDDAITYEQHVELVVGVSAQTRVICGGIDTGWLDIDRDTGSVSDPLFDQVTAISATMRAKIDDAIALYCHAQGRG